MHHIHIKSAIAGMQYRAGSTRHAQYGLGTDHTSHSQRLMRNRLLRCWSKSGTLTSAAEKPSKSSDVKEKKPRSINRHHPPVTMEVNTARAEAPTELNGGQAVKPTRRSAPAEGPTTGLSLILAES